MNFFSWLSTADGAFRFCEIVAIVAGVLTVSALIGKDVAGRVVADRKAKEMLALQKDVADARTKQAEAETRLLELQRLVKEPRRINTGEAINLLKTVPPAVVGIRQVDANEDALDFAIYLVTALDAAGWKVDWPRSGGTRRHPGKGITLEYKVAPDIKLTFAEADLSPSGVALLKVLRNDNRNEVKLQPRYDLPENTFVVIVDPKF